MRAQADITSQTGEVMFKRGNPTNRRIEVNLEKAFGLKPLEKKMLEQYDGPGERVLNRSVPCERRCACGATRRLA